ncbi:MAG: hypothetical protein ACK56D_10125 [Planctomycetota bacterium]|jgi:hypothetical protein|nr:hypothetical protein [Blastopirellula sp.]
MQAVCRITILCLSVLVVAFALNATWNQPSADESKSVSSEASETPWRYTKYGWQDLRDWRNVQAEVEPAPPAIHPLAIALGVLMLSLGAMIWIGDKEPEEKPIMAELRRQRLLNMVRR